ncbi:hypothetical protein EVAR_42707_1 [Eumeta japonica]|uniref:Uncharacterized protein n=1 Tax=Eumeta variegata TaxID=151549 RepID=A0A4C1X2E9_EUMVA|nr:hypothetical protein EVAR_42707_1 [Eumeta japonica]
MLYVHFVLFRIKAGQGLQLKLGRIHIEDVLTLAKSGVQARPCVCVFRAYVLKRAREGAQIAGQARRMRTRGRPPRQMAADLKRPTCSPI